MQSSFKLVQASRPLQVFLLILVTIFTIEACVMVLLPIFLPPDVHYLVAPLVDACTLTVLMSPVVWCFIIQPLRRVAAMRAQVLEYVLAAQEDERRRLARDLHDEIGQGLTTLLVGMRTLEESATLDEAKERARKLRQQGGKTHDEIRRLARGLRPSVLDDLGLAAALERMTEEYSLAHGIAVRLEMVIGPADRLPEIVETTLFRIIQEGLTNIAKHAHARNVTIDLWRTPDAVRANIRDDGCGFDPDSLDMHGATKNSLGLTSIRERAILLGGDAVVRSQPGHGTTIEVCIPLAEIQRGENSRVAGG